MAERAPYLSPEPMVRVRSVRRYYSTQEMEDLLAWLDDPVNLGSYHLDSIGAGNTVVWFTDPDTAFAFKIRWG